MRLTDNVTVATRAQKKLLHIVLMLKVWLISYCASDGAQPEDTQNGKLASIEKSTPPMGEPKATATPAALAAVMISRIFPACKLESTQ